MSKPETEIEASAPKQSGWFADMLKGLFYAALIIASILFFTGTASRFIYVDF
jgi:hypothetical protein